MRPTRRNRNGNPNAANGKLLDIWTWDPDRLEAWLIEEYQRSTSLICCEHGFSHTILGIKRPLVLKLATIRHPKSRLISNFMYDVQRGFSAERDILSYVSEGGKNRRPDYYTNLITGRTGTQARADAEAAIKAFDYVHILDAPESWNYLAANLTIAEDGRLKNFHSNSTNYEEEKLEKPRQSVLDADAALDALCAEESKLFEAVSAHFQPAGSGVADRHGRG